jgi:hypothetical protein
MSTGREKKLQSLPVFLVFYPTPNPAGEEGSEKPDFTVCVQEGRQDAHPTRV